MKGATFWCIWRVGVALCGRGLSISVGHGGDGFLKFQDHEEISSAELADTFQQMWQKRRWREEEIKLNLVLQFTVMITSNTPFFPIFDLAIIAIAHFATLALITSFSKAMSTDKAVL